MSENTSGSLARMLPPKPKPLTVRTLRADGPTWRRIDEIAGHLDGTSSEVVRLALQAFIDQWNADYPALRVL